MFLNIPSRSHYTYLLPNGNEEGGVLGVGSFPGAILPSCINMKIQVGSKNKKHLLYTGLGQYNSLVEYCGAHTASSVFHI